MADISTVEEAINAHHLNFDYIGTTLRGYTSYTKGHILFENDFEFLKEVLERSTRKLSQKVMSLHLRCKKVSDLGVHCTVVGGAITSKQIMNVL